MLYFNNSKMLKAALFTVSAIVALNTYADDKVPAFPGAEGHARYTTTGGSRTSSSHVYHVTNLDDSSSKKGCLRWALSQAGPRTIVFDISGYIDLQSDLSIPSNTTIAGQTAPGDGITLRYRTVTFTGCDNVIVRYMRFRRSQVKDVNDGADAAWGRQHKNIILDHCSFSWSIDEIASFYDNYKFTMQWCTLAEALANSGHTKTEHSYGGIWGGKDASFHHNFLAHMQNRVPRFNGARYNWQGYDKTMYENSIQAERVDFRNCVMYNWGKGGCYGGPGGGYINMVNNYYKYGPGTKTKDRVTTVSKADSGNAGDNPFPNYTSRYYINGNYVVAGGSNAANYDWKGVAYDSGIPEINGEKYIADANHYYGSSVTYVKNSDNVDCVKLKLDEPIDAGDVTTHSAETAYEKVLLYAGASYSRDALDARYMSEARNGVVTYYGTTSNNTRAGIIDMVNDPSAETQDAALVSYPELKSETRSSDYDTDQDGMPDEWEKANGLNPNSASDAFTKTIDTERGWYTNLEVYLNSIVEGITKAQNADAISGIDEYYPKYNAPTSDVQKTAINRSAINTVSYYALNGIQLKQPQKGINIRKIVYSDGSESIDKVIKE